MRSDNEMAARLRICAALVGGGEALSQKAGIPRRTLETYLTGEADPKGKRLAAICAAAGVNGHWLLTGEGERSPSAEGDAADVAADLVSGKAGLSINPGALAVIIEYVWQLGPERTLKERCQFAALQYSQMTSEGYITPYSCGPTLSVGRSERSSLSGIAPITLSSRAC